MRCAYTHRFFCRKSERPVLRGTGCCECQHNGGSGFVQLQMYYHLQEQNDAVNASSQLCYDSEHLPLEIAQMKAK